MKKIIVISLFWMFLIIQPTNGQNFCYTLKIDYKNRHSVKVKLKDLDKLLVTCTIHNCGSAKFWIDTTGVLQSGSSGDDLFYFSIYKEGKQYKHGMASIDFVGNLSDERGQYLEKDESHIYSIKPFYFMLINKAGKYEIEWNYNRPLKDALHKQHSNKIRVIVEE